MKNTKNHSARPAAKMVARVLVIAVTFVCLSAAPAAAQTCIASGDINHSGGASPTCGDVSIGDLSMLIDYLSGSPFSMVDYAADIETDCMIDGEDLPHMQLYFGPSCTFPPCCPNPLPVTCCDPLLIFSPVTARRVGAATVTYVAPTATVTGVGTSGEDGLRFYPPMDDAWKDQIHLQLENVDISQSGRMASIDFTQVSGGLDMEWVASLDAANDGATVTLTAGLVIPLSSTISLTASQGGSVEYSGEIVGNELTFAAVAPANPLVITGVTLGIDNALRLMVSLEQPISFSVVGQSPEVAFTANRLVLTAASPYDTFVGLGPLVMTGAGMDTFSLTATYPCCVGLVGDANGSGEDMPTIGDISTTIDALFIAGNCNNLPCLAEADLNQSGGWNPACEDITIGDIGFVIDYLFITSPAFMMRPPCLYPQ